MVRVTGTTHKFEDIHMVTWGKKLNSLQGRVIVWILIAIIPTLGLTSIWVYLFLNYFCSHYTITPLSPDTVPLTTPAAQRLVHDTLIAWGIFLGVICTYASVVGVFLNKRVHQIVNRLHPNTIMPHDTPSSKNTFHLPAEVLQIIDSIADLNNETQYKLNQYQQINADMTHELRSPLHTIGLAIESIREGLITPTPQMFAILYNEVQRIHRLVEDMRTLSLIDINKFPLHCQPTNLSDLVMHVVTTKAMLAQQHNIQISVTNAPRTIIALDADRIIQVIANVLDNAIRHSPEGATITIAHVMHADSVALTICDTGTGIAACDIPHLFTRFYRGTTPKGQGSGLGLAIAHAIIGAHRGTITIDSVYGQGTTVTIQLPRVSI